MPDPSPDLAHFLELANSDYEFESIETAAARELADCVINNVPCLDESALKGLAEFIGRAKYQPEATSNLLHD